MVVLASSFGLSIFQATLLVIHQVSYKAIAFPLGLISIYIDSSAALSRLLQYIMPSRLHLQAFLLSLVLLFYTQDQALHSHIQVNLNSILAAYNLYKLKQTLIFIIHCILQSFIYTNMLNKTITLKPCHYL